MVEPASQQIFAQSDISSSHSQDIVAEWPDEVAAYRSEYGSLPAGLQFEPSVYCVWGTRTFIHTRATLPLKAIDEGVGFGLWVEVEPADFDRYINAVTTDDQYDGFQTEGILANAWPGFFRTIGLPVKISTLRVHEKVYITEVSLDRVRDVLFETALATEFSFTVRDDILVLVQDWLQSSGQLDTESSKSEQPSARAQSTPAFTSEPELAVDTIAEQPEPVVESEFESQLESQPEPQQSKDLPLAPELEQQLQTELSAGWESQPQPWQDADTQPVARPAVDQTSRQVDTDSNQPSVINT